MLKIDLLDKHIKELEKLKARMLDYKSIEGQVDCLKDIYTYAKVIAPDFYDEETGEIKGYMDVVHELYSAEDMLPIYFISDIPSFSPSSNLYALASIPNRNTEVEFVLDYLVEKARTRFYNKFDMPFSKLDLQDSCYGSALYIQAICFLHRIKQKRIKIEPGFKKHSPLYDSRGWHYFNIIIINGRYFLIDCTYSQFFLLKRCLKESIGIMNHPGASAGAFMQEGLRKKVSDSLLTRGWIELTPEIFKAYLDGFAVSYRNGIFYQDNGILYTTPYDAEKYKDFIQHRDSQLAHEGEHLGYQMRPLKDPYMKF